MFSTIIPVPTITQDDRAAAMLAQLMADFGLDSTAGVAVRESVAATIALQEAKDLRLEMARIAQEERTPQAIQDYRESIEIYDAAERRFRVAERMLQPFQRRRR